MTDKTSSAVSYRGLIDDAKQALYDTSDTPRIDAEILLQHVINQPLSWLIAFGDRIASTEHTRAYYQLVEKRQQGQPIAYLIGERDFWSLVLSVNEHVLIPRPDTETLVEAALERIDSSNQNLKLLDLGTGSGAIALSLAKEQPTANVVALDQSPDALKVATHNAQHNQINNVQFMQSDWFSALDDRQKFDLIASNPPYIEPNDPHLAQGDLRFEPASALVAQENGLSDLRIIINQAPEYLNANGWLIVEHSYNQADDMKQLFNERGFTNVSTVYDLNQLPRCTLGQYSAH